MNDLIKISEDQIKEAISEKFNVIAGEICLYHDYEFVRRGDEKVRRDFIYAIIDIRSQKRVTNADRIRQMSDDEMATLFGDACACHYDDADVCEKWCGACDRCWLDWLKQEV